MAQENLMVACRDARIAATKQWKLNIEATAALQQVYGARAIVAVFIVEVCKSLDEDIEVLWKE